MKRMFLIVLGCAAMLLAAGLPTRGQGPGARPAVPATRSADDIVRAKLAEPVPVNFSANRVVSSIDFLSKVMSQTFTVDWAALEKAGVTKDSPVNLQLNNVPADLVVRLVLRNLAPEGQLVYRIENGAVVITTPKADEKLPDPPPADPAVTRKLNATMSANLQANKLANVIDYVRNMSGLNFFVDWPELKAAGATPQTPITLDLVNALTSTVLDHVLQAAGGDKLQWTVEGNVVVIAAKEGVATQPAGK